MRQTCPQCKKEYTPDLITNDLAGVGRWLDGNELIQVVFPKATPTECEQRQSGICSDTCWEKYMGEEI